MSRHLLSNVRGLRTKQLEFYDHVCASNFDIICLSETRINDLCYDHNLFPNRYTAYRYDQQHTNKARGGGLLTAITASLGSCSRRYDLELCSECVRVEIPTADDINMLSGNHYFSSDTKPEVIIGYFRHLENNLDTNNTSVVLLGDFNAPGFNC
jgi:exonuclease III